MRIFSQFAWMRIPLLTAALVLFSFFIFNQSKKIFFAPQTWLMVAFFGVMCLSRLLNGLDVFGHRYMVFFYKIIFVHILIINLVDSKEKLKLFIWILIISSGVLSYVARYHDSEIPFYWSQKNVFGGTLAGVIAFPFIFAMAEKKWILKGEAACYGMLMLMAILGTNSRAAFVAAGIVLCLLLITNFRIKNLALCIVIVVAVLSRVSVVHWERYETIETDIEQAGTGGQRIAAWKAAGRMMLANPMFGVGTGAFGSNFLAYSTYEDKVKVGGEIGVTSLNTHNMTLQVGSETGFLGLGLFALIIVFCFKDMKRILILCRGDPEMEDIKQMTKAIGIAFIGYFAAGQFGNFGYNLMFYTLASLIVAGRVIAEKAKKEVDKNSEEQVTMREVIPYKYQLPFRVFLFVTFSYICRSA